MNQVYELISRHAPSVCDIRIHKTVRLTVIRNSKYRPSLVLVGTSVCIHCIMVVVIMLLVLCHDSRSSNRDSTACVSVMRWCPLAKPGPKPSPIPQNA